MKNLTFLTAILIVSLSFAQIPSYVPTNGLVGWWPFNGNANDESGNGNNGTVNGATLTTDRNGVVNAAYNFDGISNYISTNYYGILGNNNRTISFWAKQIEVFNSNQCASCSRKPVLSYGSNIQGPSQIGQGFYCEFNIGLTGISFDGNETAAAFTTNSAVNDNNWHHYTYVLNNVTNVSSVKIYQDGTLLNAPTYTYNSNFNVNTSLGSNMDFGRRTFNQQNPFYYKGRIDDIGIWNRALTQQEITNLYNGAFNLPVELTKFSASCSENTTTINWQTASENNSAYFEVFQSRDGEVWTSKATTPAAGNSTSTIDYSIIDNNDASLVYYKLKQVDKDGQFKEYGPISADCKENNQLTIYPNPTTGEITLRGLEQFSKVSSLSINDINGTVVKKLDPTTTLFNVETLQAGVYFLTITAGNKQEVVKIIKE